MERGQLVLPEAEVSRLSRRNKQDEATVWAMSLQQDALLPALEASLKSARTSADANEQINLENHIEEIHALSLRFLLERGRL